MIYSFNSQKVNFIQGLSSFWQELFLQRNVIRTAYSAVEQHVARVYLDLLQDYMSASIEDMPVLRELLFRHFELRSDEIFYVKGFSSPTDDTWLVPVEIEDKGWRVNDVEFIGNNLLSPSVQLEKGSDFEVLLGDSDLMESFLARNSLLPTSFDYIVFNSNPFLNNGFAKSTDDFDFPDRITTAGVSVDFVAAGVTTSSIIKLSFKSTNETFDLPINEIDTNFLRFPSVFLQVMSPDDDESFSDLSNRGFTFEVLDEFGILQVSSRIGSFIREERELTFISNWFANLLVDDGGLSEIYGELLGIEEDSTEQYKSLLRGLLQYYVRGVSLGRTSSAANVIAGLPVFSIDSEKVLEVDTSPPLLRIQTDTNVYLADYNLPIAERVLLSAEKIDGITPDDTARWVKANDFLNFISLEIDPSVHKIKIDGIAHDINKIYNAERMLLDTVVASGVGRKYGFSIGDNAPDYDNLLAFKPAEYIEVEAFSIDQTIEHLKLQPLLSALEVVDYISDPTWWQNVLVPDALFEDASVARRRSLPTIIGNRIGSFGLQIGDPQFNIGGDEDSRISGELDYIVELPYFDKTVGEDFRVGELVRTITGLGDGVGKVLFDNAEEKLVYVSVISGRFLPTDHIWAFDSPTKAYLAWRTRAKVDAPITVNKPYSVSGGNPGTGFGETKPGAQEGWIRLIETSWPRLASVGDTITAGIDSAEIIKIEEDDFLPGRHNTAYYLFDHIFKYGVLRISYDIKNFTFPRGISGLRNLIVSGAPAYIYVFIDPFSDFFDVMSNITEVLALQHNRILADVVDGFNTQIVINGPGSTVWTIGQADYVIAGANPAFDQTLVETTAGSAVADLAVSVVLVP